MSRISVLLLFCITTLGFGQSPDTTKLIRDKSIIALPVAFRFPETGWGGGVAATSSWSWGKDSSWAKPSQASIGLTYTQNKQILAFLPFNVFFGNNKYYLNADIGWFKYNFFYYGIGENRVPEERYDVKFPRVRFLASRQVSKNLYAGLRVNYEAYDVYNQAEDGELIGNTINGSDFSRTSAIGPSILLDTRDKVFYPRKGIFGEVNILPSLKAFGADRTFTQATIDVSHYQSLHERLVLASNFYNVFSFGDDVPFSQLAQLGGPKKMRGTYQGFFRDKNASLLQAELRWEVWKFIGLVGFGSMGFLGDSDNFLRMDLPKFTYGAGLRISTKNSLNLRIDYGLSPYGSGNFYATVGEAF
ncbi:BamA/TamA family outer membrane protein [Jiulongibacter sp. NS-SX5]|uniref:BamA/TamA family outer membrane protein n=1 Tax=Jiulongibacter sp. NS-SX5 TaxID=3463854 RepID=UPI004058BD3C